ncbi:S8 family serine peptidase [Rubritalea spongiae]|uniref:S8 family serine peptidase n=1 Tax=Rubritalea spongiae TaxID=430797 RepID=A0ABW5E8Y3_9BACT
MKNQRSISLGTFSVLAVCGMLYVTYSALFPNDRKSPPQTSSQSNQSTPSKNLPLPKISHHTKAATQQANKYTTSNPKIATHDKEAILHFKDPEAYHHFLTQLTNKGLKLLGSSDRLLAARISFGNFSQLNDIENADIAPNYPVFTPTPPDVSAQDGATAFGNTALQAIGINEDNSNWGEGVTVAVIDSGVNNHLSLQDGVQQIALTELSDESEQLSHGTAVASIIAGKHPLTPGVAPSAEILSIRVTDAFGSSDSFTLAQGILQAADAGAQIINISMGSEGNSSVVAEAVRYAQDLGAVIVASSGNEGLSQAVYPAAYDGVISVGAIEANGDHLDFSNSSPNLQITAPGYQVNAAWGEDLLTAFSGTSASAPFVSGAIAATMSNNEGYTAQQATELLFNYVNEAGPVGDDPQYGKGTLDIGRVIERNTPNINDIAVTSQLLITNDAGDNEITIIFQNQGTSNLFNSPAQIVTPAGTTQISINSLSPGQTYSYTIPAPPLIQNQTLSVYSSVNTSSTDVDPLNNRKENHFSD